MFLGAFPAALSPSPDTKNAAEHDESPPRTPTGNAPSSESDIDISSPNVSHDESIAKDMSLKDSGSDLSHRPKRRRFHESYNFNMKCPTPGCNSLGNPSSLRVLLSRSCPSGMMFFPSLWRSFVLIFVVFLSLCRAPDWEARAPFLHLGVPSVPQPLSG